MPPKLLISIAEATSVCTLIWLVPVKMMPLGLMISTVPSALIEPRIWLGLPVASMRFSTTHELPLVELPALWLKYRVVFLPTLNCCQVAMARCELWVSVSVY